MEKQEIRIGNATYELNRTFMGAESVSDLIVDMLGKDSTVDSGGREAL